MIIVKKRKYKRKISTYSSQKPKSLRVGMDFWRCGGFLEWMERRTKARR